MKGFFDIFALVLGWKSVSPNRIIRMMSESLSQYSVTSESLGASELATETLVDAGGE